MYISIKPIDAIADSYADSCLKVKPTRYVRIPPQKLVALLVPQHGLLAQYPHPLTTARVSSICLF